MTKRQIERRQKWCRELEEDILTLDESLAGKIPWDDAFYLYSIGFSSFEAAKKITKHEVTGGKPICSNCGQWQSKFKGHYDCFNDCVKRGFAQEGADHD
jgi:hypothetical protein